MSDLATINRTETIMRCFQSWTLPVFSILLLASGAAADNKPIAEANRVKLETSDAVGPHGGSWQRIGALQVETLLSLDAIRVYFYDASGHPVPSRRIRGIATLTTSKLSQKFRFDLQPRNENEIGVEIDLSRFNDQHVSAEFVFTGVSATSRSIIKMRQAFALGEAGRKPIAVKLVSTQASDSPLINKQAKCPVMDLTLGKMGQPVKMLLDEKPVFLCCKGCIRKVEKAPEQYLAKVYGQPQDSRNPTDVRENPAPENPAPEPHASESIDKISDE
jgi:hypothetical protein